METLEGSTGVSPPCDDCLSLELVGGASRRPFVRAVVKVMAWLGGHFDIARPHFLRARNVKPDMLAIQGIHVAQLFADHRAVERLPWIVFSRLRWTKLRVWVALGPATTVTVCATRYWEGMRVAKWARLLVRRTGAVVEPVAGCGATLAQAVTVADRDRRRVEAVWILEELIYDWRFSQSRARQP